IRFFPNPGQVCSIGALEASCLTHRRKEPMAGSMDFTEDRFREIVERCLRLVLSAGASLPAEDEDWVASGALDSMGHVDALFGLGSRRITAAAVEEAFGLSPGTIAHRAGIETVVQVSETESEITLARAACRLALERAQTSPADLDWIVCSSETFWRFPSLGSVLHAQLLAR